MVLYKPCDIWLNMTCIPFLRNRILPAYVRGFCSGIIEAKEATLDVFSSTMRPLPLRQGFIMH